MYTNFLPVARVPALQRRRISWFWTNFKRSPILWQWPAALALQWWRRRPDKNCFTKAKIRGRQQFRRLYALLSAILGPFTILETQPNPHQISKKCFSLPGFNRVLLGGQY